MQKVTAITQPQNHDLRDNLKNCRLQKYDNKYDKKNYIFCWVTQTDF